MLCNNKFAHFLHSYNYQLMEGQNTMPLNFIQSLKFHSYTSTPLQSKQTAIYQTGQPPFDFYLSLELKGGKQILEFYHILANLSQAIIEIKEYEILPVSCTFLQMLLKKQQLTRSEFIRVYMSYYNFTLFDWKQLKKIKGNVVSQAEIVYIMKILLQIAVSYKRTYNQNAKVFNLKNIFITNSWKIILYPVIFSVNLDHEVIISTQRESENLVKNHVKVLKQQNISNNSSESTLKSSRVLQSKMQKLLDKDLIDIFLIVLQLLTYRPNEYFFSLKHKMMKWDLVRQFLNDKQYIGHLDVEFLQFIKEIADEKLINSQSTLDRLQQFFNGQQQINCLRKQNEKSSQEKNQKLQGQIQKQRKQKLRKTICLNHIGTIKKCNFLQ